MYPKPVTSLPSHRNRLILLALWLVFYCSFTLFTPPLLDDADSVHAEVAREMLVRHDFVTLYANGVRYLEKAPLYYWSMAASMKLFGASTAASRLPLAFAVLALALLLESLARQAFASSAAGLYAGLIALSSFGIFIFSRLNIPDILVCVLLTLSLYAFFLTEQEVEVGAPPSATAPSSLRVGPATASPSRLLCWTFDAAIALNLLTKGLIGYVFPVAIVALYLLLTRGFRGALRRLPQCHPISSTAILLAIAVPWHVLIALANPGHGHPGDLARVAGHWQVPYPTDGNVHGWAWFYFVNEQVYRYLNVRIPHDYDTSPVWLFYGLIFIWLMPWSAFLPTALVRAVRGLRVPHPQRPHRLGWDSPARTNVFLLVWMIVPLAFFSLSSRQEYYVLPSLPPMILLIASLLATKPGAPYLASEMWDGAPPNSRTKSTNRLATASTILLAVGAVAAAACLFFLLHSGPPRPNADLAALLTQNPADYALSFGHFLDLTGPAMALFRLPLGLTALGLFGGTLAHWLLRRRNQAHAATLALAAGAFVFLLAAHRGLVIFSPTLTSYQLAQTIAPQVQSGDLVAIHGEYEAGSTLGFYLRRNDIHIVEGRSSNLWYGSYFPDAPKIFETRESITAKWRGPRRIFLWQDPHDPDRPPLALPEPVYTVADSGGHQILSNQPNR